jgi:hypothetical protein
MHGELGEPFGNFMKTLWDPKKRNFFPPKPGLIKFGILFLDAKFAKNKNSKLPKLSGCLYV